MLSIMFHVNEVAEHLYLQECDWLVLLPMLLKYVVREILQPCLCSLPDPWHHATVFQTVVALRLPRTRRVPSR